MSGSDRLSLMRAAVLAEAETWLGTPYRHQGSRKGVGCDCLGLIRGIWRALYNKEPEQPGPYTPDWAESGAGDPLLEAAHRHFTSISTDTARPGDLLVFRWREHHAAKHLGICFGDDRFLHAYEGHAVMLSPLIPQWRRRIAGVFAFPEIG